MAHRTHRILIVDDDQDILANLSDILADVGYETQTANCGQLAVEKVTQLCSSEKCHFDLCLLDFKMPGMDGVELLQRLQSENPNLRAIMMTAYAGDDGVNRAIAAGTWSVLRKPVDIKQLLDMIDEALI